MKTSKDRTVEDRVVRLMRRSLRLLGDRTPTVDGELDVAGPTGQIRLRRDLNGVPHIEAETDCDAWFGLGFAVGQDRTFQLDFYRRAVSGTMSAAIGKAGIGHDRLVRRIGYYRAAVQQYETVDQPTRELLDAYANGLTHGQTAGRTRRSLEHTILFLHPRPWTSIDVLAFIKLITASLSTNWDAELARLLIVERDGAEALRAIDTTYPEHHPVTSPVGIPAAVLHDLRLDVARHQRWISTAGGSNNWAVDGTRTRSGRPIVANDPHLNPQVPSQWYLAHIRTPQWEAAGASLVGAPGFIVGHNGDVAWGVTAGRADLSDLVVETRSDDGASVMRPNGWAACTERIEVIDVRGSASVVERVTLTDTGPVISPIVAGEPGCLSLRATWLDPGPLRGFFDAGKQRNVEGLVETFREWNGPNVNLIAGDASGAIAWKYVASAPNRTTPGSRLPVNGDDSEHVWPTTRVPFDDLPACVGSTTGLLATANNQPAPQGIGPHLGDEWSDGYRVQRIQRQLASRSDWTTDEMARLQMDQHVGLWDEIGESLVHDHCGEPDAETARRLLSGWNGIASADSIAAAVFELATFHLTRRLMSEIAPGATDLAMGAPLHSLAPFSGLAVRRSSWLAEQFTRSDGGRPSGADIEAALADATRALRSRSGPETSKWAWGRVRPLRIHHLLADLPVLGKVMSLRPISVGGSLNTIAMCAADPIDPLASPVAMAGLRMVVEMGEWDDARFVLAGGQSGDPCSDHYDDQLPLWSAGGGITIAWSPDRVDETTSHELMLRPTRPQPCPTFDDDHRSSSQAP